MIASISPSLCAVGVITLTLLHPLQSTPIQSWTFEREPVIRIGRSTDNHVVLYSAVVSRHHVELHYRGMVWELIGKGTNGTYLDGQRVAKATVEDGMVIRLARSGPMLQIRLGSESGRLDSSAAVGEGAPLSLDRTVEPLASQASDQGQIEAVAARQTLAHPKLSVFPELAEGALKTEGVMIPDEPPVQKATLTALSELRENARPAEMLQSSRPGTRVCPASARYCIRSESYSLPENGPNFCLDCGYPAQILKAVGDYQLVKVLEQGETEIVYLAWRAGQTYALRTLKAEWMDHPRVRDQFEHEAQILRRLRHAGIPHIIDFFTLSDQPYLVSEMVYGVNLEHLIAHEGPVSQVQSITWMLEVCSVLTYLHSQTPPLIHQAIQPAHLIRRVIPHGAHSLAVVGLGILKGISREGEAIQTDWAGYTAPEQHGGQVTPASDLYSLGATSVYWLTGQAPKTFLRKSGDDEHLQIEEIPGLVPELTAILRRLTHPQLAQRFNSAIELERSLRALTLDQ